MQIGVACWGIRIENGRFHNTSDHLVLWGFVSDATTQTGGAGGSGKDVRGIGERCANTILNTTKVR